MNNILVLLTMIFLHMIADYNLQGILASMKQISWWKEACKPYGINENTFTKSKYSKDYIVGLLCHSYVWSCLIMLPLLYLYKLSATTLILFVVNVFLHAYIDDLKANKFKLNLVQDQLLHMLQIVVTWSLCCLI
jgi:hypothetical protein